MLKSTIAITQVTSDLVKLIINSELNAKGIRKSIISVIKNCALVTVFLGHANQEAGSIRRTKIALSLPKYLYSLAKDVPVPSEWLFGDDINVRINNIGAHQKVFKVDEIYFKLGRPFDKQSFLAKQF